MVGKSLAVQYDANKMGDELVYTNRGTTHGGEEDFARPRESTRPLRNYLKHA